MTKDCKMLFAYDLFWSKKEVMDKFSKEATPFSKKKGFENGRPVWGIDTLLKRDFLK
jgi:hypothetical protein